MKRLLLAGLTRYQQSRGIHLQRRELVDERPANWSRKQESQKSEYACATPGVGGKESIETLIAKAVANNRRRI
jgi:hypothetical protein